MLFGFAHFMTVEIFEEKIRLRMENPCFHFIVLTMMIGIMSRVCIVIAGFANVRMQPALRAGF